MKLLLEKMKLLAIATLPSAIVVAAMAAAACGPQYSSRPVCDMAVQERVFLECVRALKNGPKSLTAAGNDAAESVSECGDAARAIACSRFERYCRENCEVGQ